MIHPRGHTEISTIHARRNPALDAPAPAPRYYMRHAAQPTHDWQTKALLAALGQAMTDPKNFPHAADTDLAPVLGFLGHFLDHDLNVAPGSGSEPCASADAEIALPRDSGTFPAGSLAPLDRETVEQALSGRSSARLDLGCLYDHVVPAPTATGRPGARPRHPFLPGKILEPWSSHAAGVEQPSAADRPVDYLGRVLDGTGISPAPVGANSAADPFRCEFRLSLLRLHNRIVDACTDPAVRAAGSDALYDWAQTRVRWIYQWLVVNVYLRELCDPDTLARVLADQAALYRWFLAEAGGPVQDRFPLPLEFTAGAARVGHAALRDPDQWDGIFDDAVRGLDAAFAEGTAASMFGQASADRPGGCWSDWSRPAFRDGRQRLSATKAIDTNLSVPLSARPTGSDDADGCGPRNLATLNLFTGHLLNLPPAQDLLEELNAAGGYNLAPMTAAEITAGPAGSAIQNTRLEAETPLWFYLLREAEMAGGTRLGPFGTLLLSSTLLGLVICDETSYWHQPGSDNGRWRPRDDVRPAGIAIESIRALFEASLSMSGRPVAPR